VEKVCHTSTSEAYGTGIYVPIDEGHPLQGQSPYSASKIGADKVAESYFRSFGTPVAVVRPFNTFGPRQSARAVIPTIVAQVASGMEALRLGSLTPVRDLTYVPDTVEGFLAIAESPATVGEVVNLGTGRGVTIGELAALIMKIMGRAVPIIADEGRVRPPKSEVERLLCDPRKANDLTGWTAQVSLEEGLRRTIEFIRGNLSRYKVDIYNV
jgi:nucleoside-diphosphate-sugar epimerase